MVLVQALRGPWQTTELENKLQLEQRQYRHQLLEEKLSEHKFWVDNDVYDLVDMSKHPPKNFVK